jgi:hypothetical protein
MYCTASTARTAKQALHSLVHCIYSYECNILYTTCPDSLSASVSTFNAATWHIKMIWCSRKIRSSLEGGKCSSLAISSIQTALPVCMTFIKIHIDWIDIWNFWRNDQGTILQNFYILNLQIISIAITIKRDN